MKEEDRRRHLLARHPSEALDEFIRRNCRAHGAEPDDALATFSKLVFGGCSPEVAVVDALWVQGIIDDQKEDMIAPGSRRLRVQCIVDEVELEGDYTSIPSVEVTCSRCGHSTESYGQSDRSIRRCLALLREECPEEEANFYTVEMDDDDGENYL